MQRAAETSPHDFDYWILMNQQYAKVIRATFNWEAKHRLEVCFKEDFLLQIASFLEHLLSMLDFQIRNPGLDEDLGPYNLELNTLALEENRFLRQECFSIALRMVRYIRYSARSRRVRLEMYQNLINVRARKYDTG